MTAPRAEHLVREHGALVNAVLAAHQTDPVPCVVNPALWSSESAEDLATAADRCYDCSLLEACASYALAADEQFDVWGGLTPTDRGHSRSRAKSPSRGLGCARCGSVFAAQRAGRPPQRCPACKQSPPTEETPA